MKLTVYQRQVLVNQHKILEKMSDDEDDIKLHRTMQEVYFSGFESEYFEHGPYEEALSDADGEFVYAVINMYDDLYYEWQSNKDVQEEIEERKVMFPGFDLNDIYEHKLLSFARFLIKDLGKFRETRELLESKRIRELNSHGFGPRVHGYRLMLEKYNEHTGKRTEREDMRFTLEELKDIVNYHK